MSKVCTKTLPCRNGQSSLIANQTFTESKQKQNCKHLHKSHQWTTIVWFLCHHVCVCNCMYLRIGTFAVYVVCVHDVCMYACTCVRMHVSTFACMHARTYACICIVQCARVCMSTENTSPGEGPTLCSCVWHRTQPSLHLLRAAGQCG